MRLLLVEPHSLLARALRIGLDEEGFTVEVAADVEKADEKLRQKRYDVILLDLPRETGWHTFRRWRRLGLRTPVLLFMPADAEMNGRDGLDDYDVSCKPFVLEELLVRVRTLVKCHIASRCGTVS